MEIRVDMGDRVLPRFETAIPASVYVNGKQVPPIEADGEITNFSLTGLKFRCDQKIPIPSKGIVRFAFGDNQDQLEMEVQFVQRIEQSKGFFRWISRPEFNMEATFSGNSKEKHEQYQQHVHRYLFGDRKPVYTKLEEVISNSDYEF